MMKLTQTPPSYKATFSVSRFGHSFLLATVTLLRDLLLAIQFVVDRAGVAGRADQIVVRDRTFRAIADHPSSKPESCRALHFKDIGGLAQSSRTQTIFRHLTKRAIGQ